MTDVQTWKQRRKWKYYYPQSRKKELEHALRDAEKDVVMLKEMLQEMKGRNTND